MGFIDSWLVCCTCWCILVKSCVCNLHVWYINKILEQKIAGKYYFCKVFQNYNITGMGFIHSFFRGMDPLPCKYKSFSIDQTKVHVINTDFVRFNSQKYIKYHNQQCKKLWEEWSTTKGNIMVYVLIKRAQSWNDWCLGFGFLPDFGEGELSSPQSLCNNKAQEDVRKMMM